MMRLPAAWLLASAVALIHLPAAPTVAELAELFLPPEIDELRLSPDGRHIGFIGRRGDSFGVGLYSLQSGKIEMGRPDPKVWVTSLWWKSPSRLLVQSTDHKRRDFAYATLDVDSGKKKDVWRLTQEPGYILDAQPNDPDHVIMASGLDVNRFNVVSGSRTKIDTANAGHPILDSQGRIWATYLHDHVTGGISLWWRATAGGDWRLRNYEADGRRFVPRGVSQDGRTLWGFAWDASTGIALASFDTQGSDWQEVSFIKGFCPTHVLMLGQTREPVAAAYAQGEKVRLFPLAEKHRAGLARLEQTFEGFFPRIMDMLPDGKTWLVWVGNSRLPGAYFLFDSASGATQLVCQSHSAALTEDRLASAEYFTFPARGGGMLSGRLWRPANRTTLPPLIVYTPSQLPAVAAIDAYDPYIQAFVAQGFAVLRVNTRGTTGFNQPLDIVRDVDWARKLQEDMEDAVDELVRHQAVDPASINLYGWNFGAVLALEIASHSGKFTALAAVNPPAKVERNDLAAYSNETTVGAISDKLGGWSASGKLARDLSPIQIAPLLKIPALYLHNEESIAGRPNEDGRKLRSALAKAPAPVRTGFAYSWSQYPKPPSQLARESAELVLQIGNFFRNPAAQR